MDTDLQLGFVLYVVVVLEELKISHNQIALLPWRIHKLKALKSFHLGSNKIRYFPNNLGRYWFHLFVHYSILIKT